MDTRSDVEVYLAGRWAQRSDGILVLRHRIDPKEREDSAVAPESVNAGVGPYAIELRCDAPPEQRWVGVFGAVDRIAVQGQAPARVRVSRFAAYPTRHRDAWDEWVIDDPDFPQFELSDVVRPIGGGVRSDADLSSRTPSDLDEAEAATSEIMSSSIWASSIGYGAGYIPRYGFMTRITVPIVTDDMRDWLRTTKYRVGVYPIVRRRASDD